MKKTKSPERYIKRLIFDRVNSYLQSLPTSTNEKRLLDVGCGRQPFRELIEKLGMVYYGLDVHNNDLRNVDYIAAIDQPLPEEIALGSFDFILCTEVMEHVANWDRAFSNFHSLLKLGGRIILTAPFFYFLHEEPFDYWRPTPHAFRYFAAKNQLKLVTEERMGDGWDVMGTFLETSFIEPKPFYNLRFRLLFKAARFFFEKVRELIANGKIVQATSFNSPYFHSNFLVFERVS